MTVRKLVAVLLVALAHSSHAIGRFDCTLADGSSVRVEQDLTPRFRALVKQCSPLHAVPAPSVADVLDPARGEPLTPVQTIVAARPPASRSAPLRFERLIAASAFQHDVDPVLVHAIIHAESAYNPNARSPKGALGLMQVMPATAARFGVAEHHLWNPAANIGVGTRYLAWLGRTFRGRLDLQVAAYNAGEAAVKRYGNTVPPYRETREYVRRVLGLYESMAPRAR